KYIYSTLFSKPSPTPIILFSVKFFVPLGKSKYRYWVVDLLISTKSIPKYAPTSGILYTSFKPFIQLYLLFLASILWYLDIIIYVITQRTEYINTPSTPPNISILSSLNIDSTILIKAHTYVVKNVDNTTYFSLVGTFFLSF